VVRGAGRWQARWQARWQERTTPAVVRLEVRASRLVEGRSPEQVWAFIRPAESAVLIDPSTIRAYTVPGTGPGVGEQQCFVQRENGAEVSHVVTVTELGDTYAVTQDRTRGLAGGNRYDVEPMDGGTRLALGVWLDVPYGVPVDEAAVRAAMSSAADGYVARVKQLLEDPFFIVRHGGNGPSSAAPPA
jgi:hypothetical protein